MLGSKSTAENRKSDALCTKSLSALEGLFRDGTNACYRRISILIQIDHGRMDDSPSIPISSGRNGYLPLLELLTPEIIQLTPNVRPKFFQNCLGDTPTCGEVV